MIGLEELKELWAKKLKSVLMKWNKIIFHIRNHDVKFDEYYLELLVNKNIYYFENKKYLN